MTEAPRGQVFSNVLANLLAPHPDIARKPSPSSTALTTRRPRYGSWNRTAVTPPSPLQDAVSAGPGPDLGGSRQPLGRGRSGRRRRRALRHVRHGQVTDGQDLALAASVVDSLGTSARIRLRRAGRRPGASSPLLRPSGLPLGPPSGPPGHAGGHVRRAGDIPPEYRGRKHRAGWPRSASEHSEASCARGKAGSCAPPAETQPRGPGRRSGLGFGGRGAAAGFASCAGASECSLADRGQRPGAPTSVFRRNIRRPVSHGLPHGLGGPEGGPR